MAYFSNSSEGMILDEQCANCVFGKDPCPIALVQMENNYEQKNNPRLRSAMNCLVNEKGLCQMKALVDKRLTNLDTFGDLGIEGNDFVKQELLKIQERVQARDFRELAKD